MPKTKADFPEVIRFRVSKEDKKLFEDAAARRRPSVSVSHWLREAAIAHLEQEQDRERERKAGK